VTTPAPPAVRDLPAPSARDALRSLWWIQRAYWHGARRGPRRLLNLAYALTWWAAYPLLAVIQPLRVVLLPRAGRRRYYISAQRDALLGIVATRRGWYVLDHVTQRPGRGRGHALRAVVIPALLPFLDEHQIVLYAAAAGPGIAAAFIDDVPGLRVDGRDLLGRVRVARRPA
jgi:hypothetical protein